MKIADFSLNQNNQNNKISFKSHKLVNVFPVPNYENVLKGYSYLLGNQQQVTIIPKPKAPINIGTIVKTGAFNELDESKRGISHLIEHLFFDGSVGLKPDEYTKTCEDVGADVNAYTGNHATEFSIKVANLKSKTFAKILKVYSKALKYLKVPDANFNSEKEIVISEINQYKKDPNDLVITALYKMLTGLKTKSADIVAGREENVKGITQADVMKYFKNRYTPDNMETFIVGDVDLDATIKLMDKYFDTKDFQPAHHKIETVPIKPIQTTKIKTIQSWKVQEPRVNIGFLGPKNSEQKDYVALTGALNLLFDNSRSRVNRFLGHEAEFKVDRTAGNANSPRIIRIIINTVSGEEQKVLNAFKKGHKSLKTNPVSEQELSRLKKIMLFDFKQESEVSEGILSLLENDFACGGTELYLKKKELINSLTVNDINNAAEKYLNPKKAAVVVLQPKSQTKTGQISFGQKLISPSGLHEKVLPNNIRLILNDNPLSVFTNAAIRWVYPNKPKKYGLNHVLAQMFNTASTNFSEEEMVNMQLDKGFRAEFAPIRSGIMAVLKSENESIADALKLINESFTMPALTQKNLNKAKKNVIIEFANQKPDAEELAYRKMYRKSDFSLTSEELARSISKITLKDIKEYYEEFLKNSSIKAAVTGNLSSKAVQAEIEKGFNDFGSNFKAEDVFFKERPAFKDGAMVMFSEESDVVQSDIYQLFHFTQGDVKDTAALSLINSILGCGISSRLMKDLRETQNLAYYVDSFFNQAPGVCNFGLTINTDIRTGRKINDNILKSKDGFKSHLIKLMTEPISKEELVKNKKMLLSNLVGLFEDSADTTKNILNHSYAKESVDFNVKLEKAVRAMTREDIMLAARKYFQSPSVFSVVSQRSAWNKFRIADDASKKNHGKII